MLFILLGHELFILYKSWPKSSIKVNKIEITNGRCDLYIFVTNPIKIIHIQLTINHFNNHLKIHLF